MTQLEELESKIEAMRKSREEPWYSQILDDFDNGIYQGWDDALYWVLSELGKIKGPCQHRFKTFDQKEFHCVKCGLMKEKGSGAKA